MIFYNVKLKVHFFNNKSMLRGKNNLETVAIRKQPTMSERLFNGF